MDGPKSLAWARHCRAFHVLRGPEERFSYSSPKGQRDPPDPRDDAHSLDFRETETSYYVHRAVESAAAVNFSARGEKSFSSSADCHTGAPPPQTTCSIGGAARRMIGQGSGGGRKNQTRLLIAAHPTRCKASFVRGFPPKSCPATALPSWPVPDTPRQPGAPLAQLSLK